MVGLLDSWRDYLTVIKIRMLVLSVYKQPFHPNTIHTHTMAGRLSELLKPGQTVCMKHSEIVSAIAKCIQNGAKLSCSTEGNHNKYIVTGVASRFSNGLYVEDSVTVEIMNDPFEVELTITITDALDGFLGEYNAQAVLDFKQLPDGSVRRTPLKPVCGYININMFRVGGTVKPFVRMEAFRFWDLVCVLSKIFA